MLACTSLSQMFARLTVDESSGEREAETAKLVSNSSLLCARESIDDRIVYLMDVYCLSVLPNNRKMDPLNWHTN